VSGLFKDPLRTAKRPVHLGRDAGTNLLIDCATLLGDGRRGGSWSPTLGVGYLDFVELGNVRLPTIAPGAGSNRPGGVASRIRRTGRCGSSSLYVGGTPECRQTSFALARASGLGSVWRANAGADRSVRVGPRWGRGRVRNDDNRCAPTDTRIAWSTHTSCHLPRSRTRAGRDS